MRVAVIGAGPAGMTAALQLQRGGATVDLYEASSFVGGMARSIDLWGQRVDLGPHRFFSTDPRVNQFWLEIVSRDYAMVDRQTRIYYDQKFFQYPLRPLDACRQLGLVNSALCGASYLKQLSGFAVAKDCEPSFQTWVTQRFGRRLFETFFKSYSEKLWGIPCNELSDEFAAQRIKQFSLAEAVRSSFSRRRASDHKTLVDRFAYPTGGTGMVYERMATMFRASGGTVHLEFPIRRVVTEQRRVTGIELGDGNTRRYDHVISTMPLTSLVKGFDYAPDDVLKSASQLKFRNTVIVYLNVDSTSLFSDQWLYIHSPNLAAGRVTNFRNWVKELYGNSSTTILAVERWCDADDATWNASDETLIEQASAEMRQAKLIGNETILNGHVVRLPRCYPVYRCGYQTHIDVVAGFIRSLSGLTVIGRYGAFKYNNQDHSILTGLLAAENLLNQQSHDLWDINSDYESYQERTLITETGLAGPLGNIDLPLYRTAATV